MWIKNSWSFSYDLWWKFQKNGLKDATKFPFFNSLSFEKFELVKYAQNLFIAYGGAFRNLVTCKIEFFVTIINDFYP